MATSTNRQPTRTVHHRLGVPDDNDPAGRRRAGIGLMAASKAAILCRVCDPGQHTDNQIADLTAWAIRRGFEVAATYQFQESAWKGAHQKQLTEVYREARTGKFQVLLVWATW